MSKKIKDIITKLQPFSEYPIDFMVLSIKTKHPQPDGSDVISLLHGTNHEILTLMSLLAYKMKEDSDNGEQTEHN